MTGEGAGRPVCVPYTNINTNPRPHAAASQKGGWPPEKFMFAYRYIGDIIVFMDNTLYIVIPCYNEEEALPQTAAALYGKLRALMDSGKISRGSKILLVDDGSADKTWEFIAALCEAKGEFCGLKLSRNRGTQNAIAAGLDAAREYAAMVITTDADMQDDINAIDRMVDAYSQGADVVYGVRAKREKDTFFKRFTAEMFYKLMTALGCETVFNHSDYRLLSRRAMDALARYGEGDMFIRGITPMLGFASAVVTYDRGERSAGETKYTFRKLLTLAVNGMTSLSLRPLRIILLLGVLMVTAAMICLIAGIVTAARGAGFGHTLLHFSVWFAGGIVTVSLGIVGEYAGKAYMEAKRRPRYHVEELINIEPQRMS